MDFHVGQVFGDYTVTALLGAGGMGQVYKVENHLTQRSEAMKVLACRTRQRCSDQAVSSARCEYWRA